jgi:hypothetical protein
MRWRAVFERPKPQAREPHPRARPDGQAISIDPISIPELIRAILSHVYNAPIDSGRVPAAVVASLGSVIS